MEPVKVLALALVAAFALTLAAVPTASAEKLYCVEGDGVCRGGELVCVVKDGSKVACVPDPCYTTRCF